MPQLFRKWVASRHRGIMEWQKLNPSLHEIQKKTYYLPNVNMQKLWFNKFCLPAIAKQCYGHEKHLKVAKFLLKDKSRHQKVCRSHISV